MSTSDFNSLVFRVTSLGRVTRNSTPTVTKEDWKTYLLALRALFRLPNSPISIFDTSFIERTLSKLVDSSENISDDETGADQLASSLLQLSQVCQMFQSVENIENNGGSLFHSLQNMQDLSEFLSIFSDPVALGQFNWTSRTYGTYTWYGTVVDVTTAIERFKQTSAANTTSMEPVVNDGDNVDTSLAEQKDITDTQGIPDANIHTVLDGDSANGEEFILATNTVVRNARNMEDGTHTDVANTNQFEILAATVDDDNGDDGLNDSAATVDDDNGDDGLNDSDDPSESILRQELLEVDNVHAAEKMFNQIKRMKQSVFDKITHFENNALEENLKILQDECEILKGNIQANKSEFLRTVDEAGGNSWISYRDKMLADQAKIARRIAEVQKILPVYEATSFKVEIDDLKDKLHDVEQRLAMLEDKGSDKNVDVIITAKLRMLFQDKDFLSTLPFTLRSSSDEDETSKVESVATPIPASPRKKDPTTLFQKDHDPFNVYTGVPLDTSLQAQGSKDAPDVTHVKDEVLHEPKEKPQSIKNSQSAFQDLRKNHQSTYAAERLENKDIIIEDHVTQEINGIIHPLPPYTRVRVNIGNMARDNYETVFCSEVMKNTALKSQRLAQRDREFFYSLRDASGHPTSVTADKILSIVPGSGDIDGTYKPGYYLFKNNIQKDSADVDDSDDLINDGSVSEDSNFSADLKRQSSTTTLPYDYTVKLYKLEDIVQNWVTAPLQSDHTAANFYNALRTSVAKHNVKLRAYSDLTNPKDGLCLTIGLNPTQQTLYRQKCDDFLYQLLVLGQNKFFAASFGRVRAILTTERDTQRGLPVLEFILKNLGPDGFQSDSTYYNPRDRLQPPTMAGITFAEFVNVLTEYSQKNSSTVTSLDIVQLIYHELKSVSDFDKLTKVLKEEIDRVLLLPLSKQRVNDDFLLRNIVATLLHTYGDDADGICNIKGPQVRFVPGTSYAPYAKPQMSAFKRTNNARASSTQKVSSKPAQAMCKACLRYHNGESGEKCHHLVRALPLYEFMRTLTKDTRDRLVSNCKANGEEQHKYYLEKYRQREKLRQKINRLYDANLHDPDTFQHEREELLQDALIADPYLDDYNPDPMTNYDPYTREDFLDKDDFFGDMDQM